MHDSCGNEVPGPCERGRVIDHALWLSKEPQEFVSGISGYCAGIREVYLNSQGWRFSLVGCAAGRPAWESAKFILSFEFCLVG